MTQVGLQEPSEGSICANPIYSALVQISDTSFCVPTLNQNPVR